MRPGWQSNIPLLIQQMRQARGPALVAAADIVAAEVRARLALGYTSGQFNDHVIEESVRVQPPQQEGMVAQVTSASVAALGWELGHINLFTRHYERVEIWVPALMRTMRLQAAAFKKTMESGISLPALS